MPLGQNSYGPEINPYEDKLERKNSYGKQQDGEYIMFNVGDVVKLKNNSKHYDTLYRNTDYTVLDVDFKPNSCTIKLSSRYDTRFYDANNFELVSASAANPKKLITHIILNDRNEVASMHNDESSAIEQMNKLTKNKPFKEFHMFVYQTSAMIDEQPPRWFNKKVS